MEIFSALLASEFPSQRPVRRSFDVFFNLRLNKRLSKHSRHRWFETPSSSLWRHCNVTLALILRRKCEIVFKRWNWSANFNTKLVSGRLHHTRNRLTGIARVDSVYQYFRTLRITVKYLPCQKGVQNQLRKYSLNHPLTTHSLAHSPSSFPIQSSLYLCKCQCQCVYMWVCCGFIAHITIYIHIYIW